MHYYDDELTVYGLIRDLFVASSVTCFLWALHRIGSGVRLSARITAYRKLEEAYTPEEREVLIHKVTQASSQHL